MPHLRASVGVDTLNCQSHHAPSNHHLGRGQSASVKDQCTRRLLTQAASKRLRGKLGKKDVLIA